ncbi:MAG: phenylalanine--tRNA ligase subunit alpha, partial [Thermodesulfobacteriota bacterium]
MKKRLANLEARVTEELQGARAKDKLLEIKNSYLGRKGLFAALLKELTELPKAERGKAGQAINSLKKKVEEDIAACLDDLKSDEIKSGIEEDRLDVTLPGRRPKSGRLHPVTQVMDEIEKIFISLGFDIAEGPEVETDYYNFEALNIAKDHPAREMQDTFYVGDDLLLRTHTSPVQIRVMEHTAPPLRIIAPGTVFRRDSDLTHTPMFHQVEGFMVDKGVTFADLKGVLILFLQRLFGEATPVRFRPSFFPFTEPSAEVDIGCVICEGKSTTCRVCKSTGWLEILGSGMIHPNVFKYVNYDPEVYSGFAFGLGIERIAMLKYGIDDI